MRAPRGWGRRPRVRPLATTESSQRMELVWPHARQGASDSPGSLPGADGNGNILRAEKRLVSRVDFAVTW